MRPSPAAPRVVFLLGQKDRAAWSPCAGTRRPPPACLLPPQCVWTTPHTPLYIDIRCRKICSLVASTAVGLMFETRRHVSSFLIESKTEMSEKIKGVFVKKMLHVLLPAFQSLATGPHATLARQVSVDFVSNAMRSGGMSPLFSQRRKLKCSLPS